MKNSNDTIGDRTRDLPACSAVPQPTALPRVPFKHWNDIEIACRSTDVLCQCFAAGLSKLGDRVLISEEIFEMRKRILTIGMPKHQKLNKKIIKSFLGTGSFPGVKSGRGLTLTPHPLLGPLVMKE
jgi:hypothetical protein